MVISGKDHHCPLYIWPILCFEWIVPAEHLPYFAHHSLASRNCLQYNLEFSCLHTNLLCFQQVWGHLNSSMGATTPCFPHIREHSKLLSSDTAFQCWSATALLYSLAKATVPPSCPIWLHNTATHLSRYYYLCCFLRVTEMWSCNQECISLIRFPSSVWPSNSCPCRITQLVLFHYSYKKYDNHQENKYCRKLQPLFLEARHNCHLLTIFLYSVSLQAAWSLSFFPGQKKNILPLSPLISSDYSDFFLHP